MTVAESTEKAATSGVNAGTSHAGDAFKLRPPLNTRFNPASVEAILKVIVDNEMAAVEKFEPEPAQLCVGRICDLARDRLRAAQDIDERYKLVVTCSMVESKGQGYHSSSSNFWDSDSDKLVSYTYSGDAVYCLCTAYGIYVY